MMDTMMIAKYRIARITYTHDHLPNWKDFYTDNPENPWSDDPSKAFIYGYESFAKTIVRAMYATDIFNSYMVEKED